MNLVEKHIINKNHSFFNECKSLCVRSKNLYNKSNYIIRQEFIKTSKEKQEGLKEYVIYLNYYDIRRILIKSDEYCALPRKVSNQILILLDKNWKSFFKAIKDYGKNPDKYLGRPKLPGYKDIITGQNIVVYELGSISLKDLKKGLVGLSGTDIKIPTTKTNIKQCRIIPRIDHYVIEIIYEISDIKLLNNNERYCSIDLGINNLATLTSNIKEIKPLIINGKPLKSMNQFFNKKRSYLQSKLKENIYTTKNINKLTNKRNNKVNDYLHKTSKYIIDHCRNNEITTLVIGKNDNWKQEKNMNAKKNQNLVNIPHSRFIEMLKYKCELSGINIILQEESYTSKSSFLNLDPIPTYGTEHNTEFSGYRESRGMYKIKGQKKRINADVNGSYNILRKAVPNAFANGIEGIGVNPVVFTIK